MRQPNGRKGHDLNSEQDAVARGSAAARAMSLRAGSQALRVARLSLLSSVLAAVALVGSPARAAQAPAGAPPVDRTALTAKCIDCHDDASLKSDAGKSLTIHGDEFRISAHKRVECADCHADALTTRHPRQGLGAVDSAVCVGCHEAEMQALTGDLIACAS